jgi:hypothetical protein
MLLHRLGLRRSEVMGLSVGPEEVTERLRLYIWQLQPIDAPYRDPLGSGSLGYVDHHRFSFVWRHYHPQHLAPWLSGEYHQSREGTFVLLSLKLQPHMEIFLGLGLAIGTFVAIVLLVLYTKIVLFTFLIIGFALIYLFIRYLFEENCKRALNHLYNHLNAD